MLDGIVELRVVVLTCDVGPLRFFLRFCAVAREQRFSDFERGSFFCAVKIRNSQSLVEISYQVFNIMTRYLV